jgi:hypothetical protein
MVWRPKSVAACQADITVFDTKNFGSSSDDLAMAARKTYKYHIICTMLYITPRTGVSANAQFSF